MENCKQINENKCYILEKEYKINKIKLAENVIEHYSDLYEAFYIFDFGKVVNNLKWVQNQLPRANFTFAVKCNNDLYLLQLLTTLDCNFTCVSKAEIEKVLLTCPNPSKISFMNPIKPNSHTRYAMQSKVSQIVFDTEDELYKIHKLKFGGNEECEKLELILNVGRMGTSEYNCDTVRDAPKLFKLAKKLNLNVSGISISLEQEDLHETIIQEAKSLFDDAAELGFNLNLLYIVLGDEFIGAESIDINKCSKTLNSCLNKYFPEPSFPDLKILCELGGYLVKAAFTLVCKIIGKKYVDAHDIAKDEIQPNVDKGVFYYIYEGIYTSFTISMFKQPDSVPIPVKKNSKNEKSQLIPTTIWGSTCDSFDKIYSCIYLPEMDMNDWIIFPNMGAFTFCATSDFNGFPSTSIIKVIDFKSYEFLTEGKKHKYFHENDFDKVSTIL